MRRTLALAVTICAFLVGAPVPGANVELTPLVGYRLGGSFEEKDSGESLDLDEGSVYGVLLGFPLDFQSIVEIELVHHETELQSGSLFNGEPLFELEVNSIMAGGRYQSDTDKVKGFVAGGLGLTHFNPRGAGLDNEFAGVLSIGGGALIPMGQHLLLRLEGRGMGTFMISRTEIFCNEAACVIAIEGDGFLQAEFRFGLTISF